MNCELGLSSLLGVQTIQLWVHMLEGAAEISLERKHQPHIVNKRHAWDFKVNYWPLWDRGEKNFHQTAHSSVFGVCETDSYDTLCGITNQEIRWTWEPTARRGAPLLTRKIHLNLDLMFTGLHQDFSGFQERFWNMQWPLIFPFTLDLSGARGRAVVWDTATSRKVAGSIPNGVIGIFHWHNSSGRTMALGLTRRLTEMSTGNISWG